MSTRCWLIRHGEPAEEARGRCYGSWDIGLSEQGQLQMGYASRYLRDEPIAAIYASPQRRAWDSARLLAGGRTCSCEAAPDLREIDFGDFEGRTYDEIATCYPDLYRQWMETPTLVQFPNGESFSAMRTRVVAEFARIRAGHGGQTVAIVTHSGPIRILVAWALQMPDQGLFRIAQDYGALNLMAWNENTPIVQLLNYSRGRPT
ncbi:MAG: histidine phosphatase family protein [Terriglobia bacterium]|nr:MAG: histidine phosphatase family protein [Terriglobia bacterium]